MVKRNGLVAIQHYTTNGYTVQIDDDTYAWVPKYNVSLCWVKKEHVDRVLAIKNKACCGKKRTRFVPASLLNVNMWETGNRHGDVEGNSYL